MSCMIDGETFHLLTKNMKISDLDASCHITNYDTGLYDIIEINKSVKGSLGNMFATKKDKLHMKVPQVHGSKRLHVL